MKNLRWGLAPVVIAAAIVIWRPWRGDPPAIAATVNGAPVTERAIAALAADPASAARFREALIEQAIADALIRQEAARRHIALDDNDERAVDRRMPPADVLAAQAAGLQLEAAELAGQRRALLRGQVLLQKLLEADFPGELAPSEAALREAFDAAPLAYAPPPSATVRGFLVAVPESADDAQINDAALRAAALVAAARDVDSAEAFSALIAGADAVPPGVADGVLGTIAAVDPFAPPPALPALFGPALSADVARALFPPPAEEAARVVGPFHGPRGMFGLFVEERRGPAAPRFEDVRDRVRARWLGRAQLALIPRLMERLRAAATIELAGGNA